MCAMLWHDIGELLVTSACRHAGIRPRSPSTTLSRAFSSDMLCRSPTTSPLPGSPTQQRYQDISFSPSEEAYTSMPSFSWQLPPVHPSTSAAGESTQYSPASLHAKSAVLTACSTAPVARPHMSQQGRLTTARMHSWTHGRHPSLSVIMRRENTAIPWLLTMSLNRAGPSSMPMITASSAPLAFYPAASGSLHPSIQPVVSLQHLNGHSHAEHGMLSNASSASIRDR